jgi:hypothetical protein
MLRPRSFNSEQAMKTDCRWGGDATWSYPIGIVGRSRWWVRNASRASRADIVGARWVCPSIVSVEGSEPPARHCRCKAAVSRCNVAAAAVSAGPARMQLTADTKPQGGNTAYELPYPGRTAIRFVTAEVNTNQRNASKAGFDKKWSNQIARNLAIPDRFRPRPATSRRPSYPLSF